MATEAQSQGHEGATPPASEQTATPGAASGAGAGDAAGAAQTVNLDPPTGTGAALWELLTTTPHNKHTLSQLAAEIGRSSIRAALLTPAGVAGWVPQMTRDLIQQRMLLILDKWSPGLAEELTPQEALMLFSLATRVGVTKEEAAPFLSNTTIKASGAGSHNAQEPTVTKDERLFLNLTKAGMYDETLASMDDAMARIYQADPAGACPEQAARALLAGDWGHDGFVMKLWAAAKADAPQRPDHQVARATLLAMNKLIRGVIPANQRTQFEAFMGRLQFEFINPLLLEGAAPRRVVAEIARTILPRVRTKALTTTARTEHQMLAYVPQIKEVGERLGLGGQPESSHWGEWPCEDLARLVEARKGAWKDQHGAALDDATDYKQDMWTAAAGLDNVLALPAGWRRKMQEAGHCPLDALLPGGCPRDMSCTLRHHPQGPVDHAIERVVMPAAAMWRAAAIRGAQRAQMSAQTPRAYQAMADPSPAKGGKNTRH